MSTDEPVTWRQEDTDRWLSVLDQRERLLTPMLEPLLAEADLRAGERVLDVGCGTGPTTGLAARAVRPGGSVVGLDLAPELVAVARERVTEPEVEWLVGDATTVPLPRDGFDVVLSRFGVMFFADPVAAFTHLREATRPGGRLVAAVWPARTDVPQFQLAYEAARQALSEVGAVVEEPDPRRGPFSLGDLGRVRVLLEQAGWSEVRLEPRPVHVVVAGPEEDLTDVAHAALGTGHASVLLADQPEEVRDRATHALARTYAARAATDGLRLTSRFLLLTASA